MTAKLNIRIDRGGMPRSGILNKKFDLLIDDKTIGALGWGEKRFFNIPAGNHTVTLIYRHYDTRYSLDYKIEEGGTVDIDSFMDMKHGGFTIFNKAAGISSSNTGAEPATVEELLKRKRVSTEWIIEGACTTAGCIAFFILNIITRGIVPGGFIGGVLGAVLGGAIGAGINAMRRK